MLLMLAPELTKIAAEASATKAMSRVYSIRSCPCSSLRKALQKRSKDFIRRSCGNQYRHYQTLLGRCFPHNREHTTIRYPDRVKTPLEIEIKLAAGSAPKARSVLRSHGFEVIKPRVFESNIVLDDKERSLRAQGLLLRVRRAGKLCTCTYKGLEMAGPHKKREEREFAVSDFDACLAVFGALGFRETFRYEKYRTGIRATEGIRTRHAG